MFYQILINELLYKKQQDQENKIVKIWVDYTSLVPNVMIRDELIINCEVDVVDRVIPVLQDFFKLR
jgi:hypothetical protein